MLPGGPPQLNFERAAPLLGNHSADTDRDAVERNIYHGRDLTPLASVLAQLAFALDEHGSLIDYARRRALFTGFRSVTFDHDTYTRLRLQHGWSAGYASREAVLRWYLIVLLAPTAAGREFISEASQVLRIAQEQGDRPDGQLADATVTSSPSSVQVHHGTPSLAHRSHPRAPEAPELMRSRNLGQLPLSL